MEKVMKINDISLDLLFSIFVFDEKISKIEKKNGSKISVDLVSVFDLVHVFDLVYIFISIRPQFH